jgi:hypothetical protein
MHSDKPVLERYADWLKRHAIARTTGDKLRRESKIETVKIGRAVKVITASGEAWLSSLKGRAA